MPVLGIDVEAKFAQVLDGLTAIDKKTTAVARSMEGAFSKVKGTLATIGVGVSIGGLVAFAKSAIDSVDALDDLSEKTALTVEFLSKLQEVTVIGGHSLDQVASVASKLAKNVSAANGGNQQLLAFFRQLGISAAELKSKDFDTIFQRFAAGIANAPDKVNALAVGAKLAGKNLQELIPFFNDLAERGLSIKPPVTAEQAAEAEKLKKQIKELDLAILELKRSISVVLVPALTEMINAFKDSRAEGENLFTSIGRAISRAFGGGLSDALNNAKKELAEQQDALAKLNDQFTEQKQGTGAFFGKNSLTQTNALIAKTAQRINELNAQINGAELGLRGTTPTEKPKGQPVGAVVDEAATKAREAAQRALDAALLRLAESRTKQELDLAKSGAADALEILSRQHAAGLVMEADFWRQKAALQKTAADASLRAAEEEVRLREAAFKKATQEAQADPLKKAEAVNAERELGEAIATRARVQRDAVQQATLLALEQRDAERNYEKQIDETRLSVLALKGDTLELAIARAQAAARPAIQAAVQRGDLAEVQRQEAIIEGAVAQFRLNQATREYELLIEGLGIAEERINNSQRTGAIGQLEAMQKLGAARTAQLGPLRKQLAVLEEIANAGTDEAAKLRIQRLKVELDNLAASADVLGDHFKTLFSDVFASEVEKVIEGSQSITEAFRNMGTAIIKEIDRMVLKALSSKIFDSLFGKGGGAGFFGAAGGFLTDLLGLAQGGVVGPQGVVPLRRYAGGGIATSPQLAMFGEGSKPEAFVPLPDGRRIPVMMKGGTNVNVIMNITTQDANSFRASRGQITAEYAAMLGASRRNL